MMDGYGALKADLAQKCERGKITKAVKQKFCSLGGEKGEIISRAAEALVEVFMSSEQGSAEYAELSASVIEFLRGELDSAGALKRDVAVVCAYAELTRRANAGGDEKSFEALKKRACEFNESMQNLRHGLPLF